MWPWFYAGDKGETIVVACVGCWPWYVNFMRLPQARTLVQLAISSAACTSKYICVQRWAHSLTIIWNHMLVSWPCSSEFFCCVAQNKHTIKPSDYSATQLWSWPMFCDTLTPSITFTVHSYRRKAVNMKTWNWFPIDSQDPTNELTKIKISKHS